MIIVHLSLSYLIVSCSFCQKFTFSLYQFCRGGGGWGVVVVYLLLFIGWLVGFPRRSCLFGKVFQNESVESQAFSSTPTDLVTSCTSAAVNLGKWRPVTSFQSYVFNTKVLPCCIVFSIGDIFLSFCHEINSQIRLCGYLNRNIHVNTEFSISSRCATFASRPHCLTIQLQSAGSSVNYVHVGWLRARVANDYLGSVGGGCVTYSWSNP